MTSFYLSFPNNILVRFKSSVGLEFNDRMMVLLGAYVPGAILISETNQLPDVVIEHKQSEDKKLTQNQNEICIYDSWVSEFPLDFFHLLYSVVRVELLKLDLFSVHAACMGKEEYILLVGHTGVGKTSIILELLKNKELRLLSGNKTVVSFNHQTKAIAGTSTLTANQKDIERHLLTFPTQLNKTLLL